MENMLTTKVGTMMAMVMMFSGLDQHVEVVVHDRGPGVHQAGEDVGVDLRLLVALLVLDDDVVQRLQVLRGQADALGEVLQLVDDHPVGVDGVLVVHHALFQREQVQQVAVLHGLVDLLLQRVGDHVDGAQVPQVVEGGPVQELQHQVGEGGDLQEGFALEQVAVLRQDQHQPVPEPEQSHRGDLELELVLLRVVLGALEDDGDVLRLELEAGDLVGVQGGGQGVLVHLELLDQEAPLAFVRVDVDVHGALVVLPDLDFPLVQMVGFVHAPRPPTLP